MVRRRSVQIVAKPSVGLKLVRKPWRVGLVSSSASSRPPQLGFILTLTLLSPSSFDIHLLAHHALRSSSSAECVRLFHNCRLHRCHGDCAFILYHSPKSISNGATAKRPGVCHCSPILIPVDFLHFQFQLGDLYLTLKLVYAGGHTTIATRRKSMRTSSSIWIQVRLYMNPCDVY